MRLPQQEKRNDLMPPQRLTVTATISAGQSLSDAIDCRSGAPVLVYMPANLMPARLSFLVSYDGETYNDLSDQDAKRLSLYIQGGTVLKVPSEWTQSTLGGYLKLRLGSRQSPIAQDQDLKFTISIDTGV